MSAAAVRCTRCDTGCRMETLRYSVLLAALCLAAGSPIPDAENLHISFAEITTTPTPSEKDLLKQHEDLTPVCLTMLPAHGDAQPQNSSAPYKVTLNKTKTAPGDVVSVLVTGVGNQLFRGLFMQARTEQGEPVGQFLPSDDEHVRLTSCGKGRNNAISYISYQPIPSFTFQWVAPADVSRVTFRTTIVESYSLFWIGVESEPLEIQN